VVRLGVMLDFSPEKASIGLGVCEGVRVATRVLVGVRVWVGQGVLEGVRVGGGPTVDV